MFSFKGFKNKWKKAKSWCKKHKGVVVAGVVVLSISIIGLEQFVYDKNEPKEVKYEEFMDDLKAGDIDTLYYNPGDEYMRFTLFNDETREMTKKEREDYKYEKDEWRETLYPSGEDFRENMLKYGVNLVVKSFEPKAADIIGSIFSIALPFVIIIAAMKAIMGGMAKTEKTEKQVDVKTKFSDVIGHDEVIEDLKFIVSLMQDTSRLKKFNMEVPRGMLFSGEPGTGKTLLAKAIAGESGVPFLYLNGSSCIEMYAGLGAKRVRDLFKEAKKCSPCIVFIDEIDAIGMNRTGNGSFSENVQTLNALLQEMDGFDTESGIFVIGATNNADTLDKALVRAGRFDRQVVISPPKDWTVRKEIFEHYLQGVSSTADLDLVSKQCMGFTGADINAVVNEAKLIASMGEADSVTTENIEEAIDKRIFKGNRSKRDKKSRENMLVAYHEAGHAIVTYLCGKPIARATIVSTTSGVGGFVMQTDEDKQFMTKTDLESQLMICYGGRCSERIKFTDVSTGASNDITQATNIIEAYVEKYGFNSEFGMLDLGVVQGTIQLSSEKLVKLFSDMAKEYERKTFELLSENYYLVERLAQELLDKETLSSEAITEIIKDAKENKENMEVVNEKFDDFVEV